MNDPRQFNESGLAEFVRNLGQNKHYWGYVVGQCVYWQRMFYLSTGDLSCDFKGTDNQLRQLYHNRFKRVVLLPVFNKTSTRKLLEGEYLNYVSEIDQYLSYPDYLEKTPAIVDIFQFGVKPEKYKYR